MRNLHREGQDLNEQTQFDGNTALHIATQQEHMLIVRYLVENGADVSIVNKDKKTAMDYDVRLNK